MAQRADAVHGREKEESVAALAVPRPAVRAAVGFIVGPSVGTAGGPSVGTAKGLSMGIAKGLNVGIPVMKPAAAVQLQGPAAAMQLLGCELAAAGGLRGRIVETEYYCAADPASHSYRGRQTARNAVMFRGPGLAYVYRSYGIHNCMNITCAEPGSAVLIRAVEPISGLERMKANAQQRVFSVNGPGKLTKAFAISLKHNGHSLLGEELPRIEPPTKPLGERVVVSTPRIGISKAKDKPWRFLLVKQPT